MTVGAVAEAAARARAGTHPPGRRGWAAPLLAVLVVALMDALDLDVVVLLLVPLLLAWTLFPRLEVSTRVLLAVGGLVGWLCLVGSLASFAGIRMGVTLFLGPPAALAVIPPVLARLGTPSWRRSSPMGWLPLLLAGAAGAFLASAGRGRPPTHRMSAVAGAEDNASHFSMVRGILHEGRMLYAYVGEPAGPLDGHVLEGHWSYPQGFHLPTAFLAQVLQDSGLSSGRPVALFNAYWLGICLTFTLLVLAASVATGQLARRWGAGRAASAAAVGVVSCAVLFGPAFELFALGFPSQVASYWALLALLAVTGLTDEQLPPVRAVLVVALLNVAVAHCWYLVLPVSGVISLAWAAGRLRELVAARRVVLPVVLVAALGVLTPVLVSLSAGAAEAVNAAGAVTPVPRDALVLLGGCALAAACTVGRGGLLRAAPAAAGAGVALVFVLVLGQYQRSTSGGTSYYYEKSLYTLLLLLVVLAGAIAAVAVHRLTAGRAAALRLLAVGLLAIAAVAPLRAVLLVEKPGQRTFDYRAAMVVNPKSVILEGYLAQEPPAEGRGVLVWRTGSPPVDEYLTSRWLCALAYACDDPLNYQMGASFRGEVDEAALVTFLEAGPALTVLTKDPAVVTLLEDVPQATVTLLP